MNVSEVITQSIIDKLEAGVIPWTKPYYGVVRFAMNFKSRKTYRGINMLMLGMAGYRSPYWLTYRQTEELGGQVPKGTKGHRILFAKVVKYEDSEGKERDKAIYRYSTVFNLDVIEDIDCPYKDEINENTHEFKYIQNCEEAITQMRDNNKIPEIEYHDLAIASYSPSLDIIKTCRAKEYVSDEAFYSTIFHEITHSTGHVDRLNRNLKGGKKSQVYAKEELIAEIGACFLCSITGIVTKTIDNSASYIKGWLLHLREDPMLIIKASSNAQKAFDYLEVKIMETEEV